MKKILLIVLALPLFLTSCMSSKSSLTRSARYEKMYEEQPISIMIMPPINHTNNVAAKEYLYTTLYQPLCDLGYYVFAPYMTLDVLQQESAYDSDQFLEGDLSKFKEYIGADAVLFTIVNKWNKGMSSIHTNIEYRLVSTQTNEVLYNHVGDITLDLSTNNGGLFGLIADAIVTAATPIVTSARNCNAYVLSDLPRGKYSEHHLKDQEFGAQPLNMSATIKK